MNDVEIEFNTLEISDEQAETFAYSIYRDIADYIDNNLAKFFCWLMENLCKNKIIILNLENGIICKDIAESNYKICQYK